MGTVPLVVVHLSNKAPFSLVGLIKLKRESSCWQEVAVYPLSHDILPSSSLPIPEGSLIYWRWRNLCSVAPSGWESTVVHSANTYQLRLMCQTVSYMPRTRAKDPALALPEWCSESKEQREADVWALRLNLQMRETHYFSWVLTDTSLSPVICR